MASLLLVTSMNFLVLSYPLSHAKKIPSVFSWSITQPFKYPKSKVPSSFPVFNEDDIKFQQFVIIVRKEAQNAGKLLKSFVLGHLM